MKTINQQVVAARKKAAPRLQEIVAQARQCIAALGQLKDAAGDIEGVAGPVMESIENGCKRLETIASRAQLRFERYDTGLISCTAPFFSSRCLLAITCEVKRAALVSHVETSTRGAHESGRPRIRGEHEAETLESGISAHREYGKEVIVKDNDVMSRTISRNAARQVFDIDAQAK